MVISRQISELTEAQRAAMPGWRDKWIRIGLSTDPADRLRFEAGAHGCYRAAGLAPPKRFVWVESPYVLSLASVVLEALHREGTVDGTVVHDAVVRAVGRAVDCAVDGAVDGAVGRVVGLTVGLAVDDVVGRAVGLAVGLGVNAAGGSAVDNAMRDAVNMPYLGGQFWVGGWWLGGARPAFVSFFTDVCGLALSDSHIAAANAYRATCESACWWLPYKDFVLVSERPTKILRDEQGRLHSETGNAIEWPDGWGFASWHGTRIPVEWITQRDQLIPEVALTWPNIEQRRAAAEIIGWAKVLATLPHTVIDEDPDPQIGTLISVDLPDAPGARFVLVRCATGRDFALAVPLTVKTALEANAWTFGLDSGVLKTLEVRT